MGVSMHCSGTVFKGIDVTTHGNFHTVFVFHYGEDRADFQHHHCMGLGPGVVELAPLSRAQQLPPSFDPVRLLVRVITTRPGDYCP